MAQLQPVDLEGGDESTVRAFVGRSQLFDQEGDHLGGAQERRWQLHVIAPGVQVTAQLAVLVPMAGQVVVEPQEGCAHHRGQTDLEIVGQELEPTALLSHCDDEVEPGAVVALDVRHAANAALVLLAAHDAMGAGIHLQRPKVTEHIRRRPDELDEAVHLSGPGS
jgi:hypothetical protein